VEPSANLDDNAFGDDPTGSTPLAADLPDTLRAAQDLTARGRRVVPIPLLKKAPTIKGWQNLRLELDDLAQYFDPQRPSNIGVLLGEPSGGLTDVDLDAPEAVTLAESFLPRTGSRFGRPGKPGSHHLYVLPVAPKRATTAFKDIDKTVLVEIRSTGGQTVVPPSIHPSSELISWEENGAPLAIDIGDLQPAVVNLAIASVLARHWPEVGSRDEAAMAVAGMLLRLGFTEDVVQRIIESAAAVANDDEPAKRGEVVARTAAKMAAGEPVTGAAKLADLLVGDGTAVVALLERWVATMPKPTSADDPLEARPTFDVTGDLGEMVDEAWAAILSANKVPTIFRRGALPVRLERDDDNLLMTKILTEDRTRLALSRCSRWMRQTRSGLIEVIPPIAVVEGVLASPDPVLPVLDRITEVPTFTPSGRIRQEPGYDPDARTYYDPPSGLEVPGVSERPTASEIARARALILEDLLGDFVFASEADRAHAVALLLLAFAREMVDGPTPLHNVEAPSIGTGKTLMVKVALMPAHGKTIAAMAEARDEDEVRKRLAAKIFAAAQVIFVDNVRRKMDSGALASALTAYPRWEDRILGKSEAKGTAVRCTWVSTGNNPTFSAEIMRRSVRIRLMTTDARPWLRTGFKYPNLLGWALDNRGRLIWAALTLIQAWVVAGRPAFRGRLLGGFDDWSRVMGGVLETVGIPGFLGNLEEFYAEVDEETEQLREYLGVWWTRMQDKPMLSTELVNLPSLPDEILDVEAEKRPWRLGKWLRNLKDKPIDLVDGPTITVVRDEKLAPRIRAVRWRLRESK